MEHLFELTNDDVNSVTLQYKKLCEYPLAAMHSCALNFPRDHLSSKFPNEGVRV